MDIVKVSSKGQIVIPNSLRESHHIQTGDRFIVTCVGNELRLKPAHVAEQSGLKAVAGMLQRPHTSSQLKCHHHLTDLPVRYLADLDDRPL